MIKLKTKATSKMENQLERISDRTEISVKAVLVGRRLDLTDMPRDRVVGNSPLAIETAGGGVVVLFRCGVVVFNDVSEAEQSGFIESLKNRIGVPVAVQETENWKIVVQPDAKEGLENDCVIVKRVEIKRLQLIANALSKSVVLNEFEASIKDVFQEIEPFALNISKLGRGWRDKKKLLSHIGQSLLSQQRLAGRASISDKPELLWDNPELEAFYLKLEDQLEIEERFKILDRKLNLVSKTASTAMGLLNTRQGHRLEWYIVFLIVVEIVLLVFDLSTH